jgi:hypothetical protein
MGVLVVALLAPASGVAADPAVSGATETAALQPEPYAGTLRSHRPEAAWVLSRSELIRGRAYPDGDERKRLAFERALDSARRAREQAPSCAECCLYEFAATAQLATLGPPTESLSHARQAGRVLEVCLAAAPPRAIDADGISEQAKLYFGAAQYYRRIPQSAVLGWILGLNGDAERAVVMARDAVALEPERSEYRVELAASLLCHANQRREPSGREEARALLEALQGAPEADARAGAADLASAPDDACSFGAAFPGAD